MANRNGKEKTQAIIILLFCIFLLLFMWTDLSRKIEQSAATGATFELNDKIYRAILVGEANGKSKH